MIGSDKLTHITHRWIGAVALVGLVAAAAVFLLVLILVDPTSDTVEGTAENQPATVEAIEGSELNRLTLTEKAAERLGIQTMPVREDVVEGDGPDGHEAMPRKVVPYGALLYDLNGGTFVYTNPEPLNFVRSAVNVDYIEGDLVVLWAGPPLGTDVVTVGGAELIGIEFGLGK